MKKFISILLSLTMLMAMAACGKNAEAPANESTQNQSQTEQTDKAGEPSAEPDNGQSEAESSELYADPISVTIELENGAVMKGELYPNLAPKTVENFVKLAKDKFYDGLIFHRVIDGFMIQGGGYDTDLNPKETEAIEGEFEANGFKNPLKHTKGVLSMARTQDPNSASSQFFIMQETAPHLDGQYAAFGRITEGLEYIDEIATAKTGNDPKYGMSDYPIEEQFVIKSISIGK